MTDLLDGCGVSLTSPADNWSTPPKVFAQFDSRFRFTIDVAASPLNAKCERYYTTTSDGLRQSWAAERVWCNPPYSDIWPWVKKAWQEWNYGAELIVLLVPANRTEQRWWQQLVEPARRDRSLIVEFLPDRVEFIRPNAATGVKGDRPRFGCCLLIWGASEAAQ
jgi:phage N-6-adenine-methyltransferase